MTNGSRHFLLALIALQLDLIDLVTLQQAVAQWSNDKSNSLADVLERQGSLSADERKTLDVVVEQHLARHENDAGKSAAALHLPDTVLEGLREIPGSEMQAILALLHPTLVANDKVDTWATSPLAERSGPPRSPRRPASPVTSAAERYRILRPHARGALGKVSVAMDVELNREVALKEMQSRYVEDDACRGRFVQEAEITGGLEHPNIVPVYGLGTYPDGRPFYAMRFIRGTSLQDAIAQLHGDTGDPKGTGDFCGWNLEFRRLLMRFIDVCDAVQYAHDRGILHRDLKPANIMLGKYGETLVVDWGIAKRLNEHDQPGELAGTLQAPMQADSSATMQGSLIGTPQYMSPEQAAGNIGKLGPRSDVYSLGATLFHLVTGVVPVSAETLPEIIKLVQTGDFPGARERNPLVPRALEAICRKAMAISPDDRYASATALAKDIEAWLADEPVEADPDSPFERVARAARRHRGVVRAAVAGVLVVAVVSLAAVVLVNDQRLKNANLADEEHLLAQVNEGLAKKQGALADKNASLLDSEREAKGRAERLAQEMSLLANEKGTLAAEKSQLAEDNGRLAEKMRILADEKGDLADEQAKVAEQMRRLAEQNANLARDAKVQLQIATAERLAAQSRLERRDFPQRSALLAVESAVTTLGAGEPVLPLAQEELYEALQALGGRPVVTSAANTIGPRARSEFTHDFRRLACAAKNNDVHVWDLQAVDPAKALVVLPGHRAEVSELTFALDGKHLASGDAAGEIRVWNVSGLAVAKSAVVLTEHHSRVDRLAFAADGGRLVSFDTGGEVRVWNLTAGDVANSSLLLRHPGARIEQIALDREGRRLATGDDAGEVRLWDLAAKDPSSGTVVLTGHQKAIVRLALSDDSRRLATGDDKGEVRLWNLTAGDVSKSAVVLTIREGRIHQFVFSSNGRRLAVLAGGQVRVTDLTATDLAGSSVMLRGQKSSIRECHFTSDGHWLVTGGARPGELRLWDLTAPGLTASTLLSSRNTAGIELIVTSPDGRWLAAIDEKGQADIFDLTAPDIAASLIVLRGHDAKIEQLAFVTDNRRILTRSADGQVRQWDLTAPDLIDSTVLAHQVPPPGVGLVFTTDSRRLATGDATGLVRLWDLAAVDVPRSMIVLTGHKDRVQHAAFTHHGQKLATADARGEVRLWDLSQASGTRAHSGGTVLVSSPRAPIRELAFSPDDNWLAMYDGSAELRMWNLASADVVQSQTALPGHQANVQLVKFSSDSRELLSADEHGEVRIWRLGNGPPQCGVPLPALAEKLHGLSFHPSGHHLLIADVNGAAKIRDIRAADPPRSDTLLEGHAGKVLHARFTPDGKRVVSADEQGGVRLWDLSAPQIFGSAILLGGHSVRIDQLAINPDGRRLLTGDASGQVRLWKLTADKVDNSAVLLHGYDSWIASIAFSDDGDWLAAKDARGELRLWNISSSDAIRSPVVMHGHDGEVLNVSFSPDGRWLATGDDRGTIRLWDLNLPHLMQRLRRAAGRDLNAEERMTFQLPKGASPE